jgi:hypothetical protein
MAEIARLTWLSILVSSSDSLNCVRPNVGDQHGFVTYLRKKIFGVAGTAAIRSHVPPVAPDLLPANIGNGSRTMRRDGEVPVRVVFDLGARREPQAFAADAVSLWIFNRSLLILNELLLHSTKLMKRSYPAHGLSIWHNPAIRGACGFVLAEKTSLRT